MKATEFTPGTIIKALSPNKKVVFAIAPGQGMALNTRLLNEFNDKSDLLGIDATGEVCTTISSTYNFKKADSAETFKVIKALNKCLPLQFKLKHVIEDGVCTDALIDIDTLTLAYHKVYTKSFESDELVLVRPCGGHEWALAHYSHCTPDNIHIVQPGVPVREIIPYKGNEKLLGKR